MVVDIDRCIGCQACVVACQSGNFLRPDIARCEIKPIERGDWPHYDRFYFAYGCLQCEQPRCVGGCPTGASYKRNDGIVCIDATRCIGCGVCLTECEFGARSFIASDKHYFNAASPAPYEDATAHLCGTVDKCDFCSQRIDKGLKPFCVDICPVEARIFETDFEPAAASDNTMVSEPGAALYYRTSRTDIDIGRILRSDQFISQKEATASHSEVTVNPSVLAGTAIGIGVAGLALGGCSYKMRASRKKSDDV